MIVELINDKFSIKIFDTYRPFFTSSQQTLNKPFSHLYHQNSNLNPKKAATFYKEY